MDRFHSIQAFVRVAQASSFIEAARQLGISKSVISSRVAQLEEFVGSPLFLRTTRSVRLTEGGRRFFDECEQWVGRATDIVEQMRDMNGSAAGVLRVHALPGFVQGPFGRLMGEFQDRHPEITLDLVVSDAVIDPVKEGFDCVLQIFEPVSDQLVARKLFPWRGLFCASTAYLAKHGTPLKPQDLTQHRLGLYSRYPTRDRWNFRKGGRLVTLELNPALRTNSVQLLRDYALADAGVVCLPTFVAADGLLSGCLQPVLGGYSMPRFWFSAVYPAAHRNRLKLRLFLDLLAAKPNEDAPWDVELLAQGLIDASV